MTEQVEIKVVKLDSKASIPTYAHTDEFGDLCADVRSLVTLTLKPAEVVRIQTGLALQLPPEFGALIQDRSGLAARGVCTLAGVIDPGYRGEIQVVMANIGKKKITVNAGDRIAQLRIVRRIVAKFTVVNDLDPTPRGHGGFGSTGT